MSSISNQFKNVDQSYLQKRSFISAMGDEILLKYEYKIFNPKDSKLLIETPEPIRSVANGERNVRIKYLQYYDGAYLANGVQDPLQRIFRVRAQNIKNNFDNSGRQTDVIAYLTFDLSKKYFQTDSQPFDQDSIKPLQFFMEEYDKGYDTWSTVKFTSVNSYIYADICVIYDQFNQ